MAEDIAIMIDTPLSQAGFGVADRKQETLQEYVCALLARQQALDALETIHQQINHAWAAMRKLVGDAVLAGASVRTFPRTRAMLAAQARNSYRLLEKRREECISILHQAECRANAALHGILTARAEAVSRSTRRFSLNSKSPQAGRGVGRVGAAKKKTALV